MKQIVISIISSLFILISASSCQNTFSLSRSGATDSTTIIPIPRMPIGNSSCSWIPEGSKIVPSFYIPNNKFDTCRTDLSIIRNRKEFENCFNRKRISIDWKKQMVIRVSYLCETSFLGCAFSDKNNLLTIGLKYIEQKSELPKQGVLQEYPPTRNIRTCNFYIVVSKLPETVKTEISYCRSVKIEDLKSLDDRYHEIP